jgi:hypothetical protein
MPPFVQKENMQWPLMLSCAVEVGKKGEAILGEDKYTPNLPHHSHLDSTVGDTVNSGLFLGA